jgi:hypothetical protein
MSAHPTHSMIEIPAGKTVADFLPQYTRVTQYLRPIGAPCATCACCIKPFTTARKPRMALRLYPVQYVMPIAFLYRLCGLCARRYCAGGHERQVVLAAIERFVLGDEVPKS